jgi:prephenate dehydrogenase
LPLHRQNLFGSLKSLAIFGPGLIGGSLLQALRERFPQGRFQVWGRHNDSFLSLHPWVSAQPEGSVVLHTEVRDAVRGVEGMILCTPVECMEDLLRQAAPHLPPDAWVTDAGSVKQTVVSALAPLLPGRFVGAHPMAGSEKSGFAAARPDLFENSLCFVTPGADASAEAVAAVTRLWQAVGCRVENISPEEHDRVMARVSHLPHALAALLCLVPREGDFALAGPGFRDTTRVATGSPALWTGILLANRDALLDSLDDLEKVISALRGALTDGEQNTLLDLLHRAAKNRNLLP